MIVVDSIDSMNDSDEALVERALEADELIVLPTDTVYGIAARPTSRRAIDRLLNAKGRGRDYPSPILVGSLEQVEPIVAGIGDAHRRLMEALWPGALTIVMPANANLGWDLGETNGTVAVRMPDDDAVRAFLTRTGPLAVTSANLHGMPPAANISQAQSYFGNNVAVYIDGGRPRDGEPSTIVSVNADNAVEFLRTGAIDADAVVSALVGRKNRE